MSEGPGKHLRPGMRMNGYLLSAIGLGEALRNLGLAGEAAGIPLSYRAARLPGRETFRSAADLLPRFHARKAELFSYGLTPNPEMLRYADPRSYLICYPFWELSGLVPEIADPGPIQEYWAPTRFIGAALEQSFDDHGHSPRPVHWVAQPIPLPDAIVPPRANRDELRVYTFFDTDSFVSRKNPQGAIRAFCAAFPKGQRDVRLVVKLKGERDKALRGWLADQAAADNRITVIDSVLSAAQMQELMAGCDAFLSLHRSEGFGLGPAEAMAQGKAVVASAYGGVCDFVNEQTAYPVPCIERLIAEGEYVHADGQVWGEPDIDAAVAALRRVYDAPEDVASKASAGFELLQRQHSFAAVGARMLERLEYLGMLD